MTNKEKIVRNKIHKGLDDIYKASAKIAKAWGMQSVPLTTLTEVIERGKVDLKSTPDQAAKTLFKAYNTTLDTILKTCRQKAKQMRSENVSCEYIKLCVNHVKENMGI